MVNSFLSVHNSLVDEINGMDCNFYIYRKKPNQVVDFNNLSKIIKDKAKEFYEVIETSNIIISDTVIMYTDIISDKNVLVNDI